MKKIIALAMSALLAVSAAVMPAAAVPAVPSFNEGIDASFRQARPVSAEELAQVRNPHRSETITVEETVIVEPTVTTPIIYTVTEDELSDATVTVDPASQVEQPVVAQITASMVILEYREGYEYRVSDGDTTRPWQTSNLLNTLHPSRDYSVQQRLAGRPETESDPLLIRTADRTPCSIPPAAPVVDECHTDCIVLVQREGYEYRMNNGQWQDDCNFCNLKANTEYVFYQRIKETADEYASEPTTVRAKTRAPISNTSYENYDRLAEYVVANGFEDDLGNSILGYSVPIDETNTYYFVITYRYGDFVCNIFNVSDDPTYVAFDTTFLITKYGNLMWPHSYILSCYEGEWVEEVDASVPTTYASDYTDFCFDTVDGSSAYLSEDIIASIFNSTIAAAAGFWDEMIYQELGFGLKGLGFVSYDGYGALFCSISAGYHIGTPVTVAHRAPGCAVSGREESRYCSSCGEALTVGSYIPPKSSHEYNHDCDPDCNVCGELRTVTHLYSFACDVECDICGAVRTDPLAVHIIGKDRVCTKCGYSSLLIGDVSGDGKVNMGDVAKVYAHTRGRSLLTDNAALAAADTSGDGKINLGDVTRIYAHITGKKPLW